MTLLRGDCLDVLRDLDEASVDACITDPPYHMTSIVRRFGAPGAAEPTAPVYKRSVGGFMNQTWDGGDLSFRPETWAAVLRVLRPGAYIAAMGATRCWHRTAVAIEDAGFDIRDSLAWLYGSGFPKSHNDGPRGTALKPAWEPIVIARKPLDGTHAANYARHGTGYMNIDDARVPLNGDTVPEFETNPDKPGNMPGSSAQVPWTSRQVGRRGGEKVAKTISGPLDCMPGTATQGTKHVEMVESDGRWPANVVHDGSPEVVAAFPYGAGGSPGLRHSGPDTSEYGWGGQHGKMTCGFDDMGSAARFMYCAKPSRAEKEAGLDGLPTTDEPLPGSKVSGTGKRVGEGQIRACTHPTVKPIELFRWLIRLLAPPGGVVLDPFAGSGTTGIASVLESRTPLLIEREPAYADIAEARMRWWSAQHARKPGRTVGEILGEVSMPRAAQDGVQAASQGVLL